ncbi:phage minor tail protein L [Morganella morganii]|uniref:phage minor tail protein L n=1 Tax=Morganella morganii TaxID=582 RepID=UPI00339CD008
MQNISPEMRIAVTELASDPEIELFEIDLTHIGGIRYRFYNGMNGQRKPLIWQKQVYDPYPVSGEGFTYSGKGPSGRPTITLSNLFGLITGIVSQLDGAGGGYVIRRVVKSRFLDADNFEGGNPDADPSQEIISRWVIEQVTSLNNKTASFMLAAPSETDGAMLPCRVILSDVCPWGYRSAECGYAGPPVADEWGKPTSDPAKDKCGKRLSDCKLRNNQSRIGAFVSTSRLSK